MLREVNALYRGLQIRIAFMETKSSTYSMGFISKLVMLASGLAVTLFVLGSLFSEGIRENVMGFTEVLIANGAWKIHLIMGCYYRVRFFLAIQLRHI